MIKLGGLFLVVASFAGIVNTLECDQQKPKAHAEEQGKRATPAPTSTPVTKPGTVSGEIKELSAGSHCTVLESFVFVARDAQTYQALESLNISLPDLDADFFKSHAVIAAFLGQRRTGGFGVDITQDAAGVVQIVERTPRGMVTMVLTAPFKIVAVRVQPDVPITLSLAAASKERLRTYRLAGGDLSITGGFAGVHESAGLEGSLQVMRAGTLATFIFELKSTGKQQTQLRDVASGTVAAPGQVSLTYLDSHSLTAAIQSPFKATGQFTDDEKELSLNLETVSSPNVSDNFSARASLKAKAITPRPPNRALTSDQ